MESVNSVVEDISSDIGVGNKLLAFIHKRTLRLIDVLPYPVEGGLTPNHGEDFYIVVTDISGNIGDDWSPLIQSQLGRLRALYPDIISYEGDIESVVYGKYSELGFCSEPWEEVNYANL